MLYLIHLNIKSSFHEYQHDIFGYIHQNHYFDVLHLETQRFFYTKLWVTGLTMKYTKETFGSRNAMCSYKHSNISKLFISIKN